MIKINILQSTVNARHGDILANSRESTGVCMWHCEQSSVDMHVSLRSLIDRLSQQYCIDPHKFNTMRTMPRVPGKCFFFLLFIFSSLSAWKMGN